MDPFERFWNMYPVKKAKGAAMKAWEKIAKDLEDLEEVFLAIDMQKRYRNEAEKSGEFVPPWKHPATWLNQRCWEDEVGSVSALKIKAEKKFCACGKPSLFSEGLCADCYEDSLGDNRHGPTKVQLYEAAKRHGFGKLKTETFEEYCLRCKQNFRTLWHGVKEEKIPEKTTAYLEAHADYRCASRPESDQEQK